METADPLAADPFDATTGPNGAEATATRPASSAARRRYARIAVTLPVVVRDQFGGREETRTQFVMIRGAVIAIASNVRAGHKLTIQIAKTGRAAECHVVGIEAGANGAHAVEVEFTRDQQDFWPVQFPPEDFKTDSGKYRFASSSTPPSSQSSALGDGHRTVEPSAIGRGGNELVSLADAIAGDSFTPTTTPTPPKAEKFTPRSAPVDSVAQFRAANRAAHRREQRTKALYSLLTVAGLAVALLGVRYWTQHRSEMAEVSMPEVSLPKVSLPKVSLPSISRVLPKAKSADKSSARSNSDQSEVTTETSSNANTPQVLHSIPMPAAPDSAATPEVNSDETQVAVRHGAGSTPSRKVAEVAAEEPLALPLRVDDSNSTAAKPEVLNEVVAQTPMKAALLAPQPVRKAVPAKLVFSTAAQYPSLARQMRVDGEVVISLDVDTSGKVSAARAISGPPVLRAAALDAVKRWKYQPAMLGDKAVVSTEVVKVQFKLR